MHKKGTSYEATHFKRFFLVFDTIYEYNNFRYLSTTVLLFFKNLHVLTVLL